MATNRALGKIDTDINLEFFVVDLGSMHETIKGNIFIWYCNGVVHSLPVLIPNTSHCFLPNIPFQCSHC